MTDPDRAIAAVGLRASEMLGLEWTIRNGIAAARLGGKTVCEVRTLGDDFTIKMCIDHVPVLLHQAAFHGITVLRSAEVSPMAKRRRRK